MKPHLPFCRLRSESSQLRLGDGSRGVADRANSMPVLFVPGQLLHERKEMIR